MLHKNNNSKLSQNKIHIKNSLIKGYDIFAFSNRKSTPSFAKQRNPAIIAIALIKNMKIKNYKNLKLENKTVLVRVDYNVPLQKGIIQDDTRILSTLSTLKDLRKRKAKIILLSHLGRPEGKRTLSLSLVPVAKHLEKLLKTKVHFTTLANASKVVSKLKQGEIALLENMRFHKEEERNDRSFAKKLSSLGDVFINDAFATAHRAHASTYGISKLLPTYAGLLMEAEIKALNKFMGKNPRPFTLIIGGAKIDTKIGVINNFIGQIDNLLLGGGVANTFLKAGGIDIKSSIHEDDRLPLAKKLITKMLQTKKNLYLPIDSIVAKKPTNNPNHTRETLPEDLKQGEAIFDIGKQAIKDFSEAIAKSKTIIWNGPLGLSEFTPFAKGTKEIAKAIARSKAKSLVGGGDSLDCLKRFKIPHSKFTHVSTGGGAMLEYIEGKKLPGVLSVLA